MAELVGKIEFAQLLIVALGYLAAGFIKGATGLGFSTTCLPILALALGLKEALPLVIFPSITSNILVMIDAGGFITALRRFWPLYLALLPGLVSGLALLAWIDARFATAILGVVLISYALYGLSQAEVSLGVKAERWLKAPIGYLTGFINGLTGSQVLPLVPYMLALGLLPAAFVQTINISFSLSSLVMAGGLVKLGFFTWPKLLISLAGLLPTFIGVGIGNRVRQHLSVTAFRRAVLIVLLLLGAGLIARLL